MGEIVHNDDPCVTLYKVLPMADEVEFRLEENFIIRNCRLVELAIVELFLFIIVNLLK